MNLVLKRSVLGLAGAAALTAGPALAVEKLSAVHAFPPFLVYTQTFLSYVDEVNKRGAGVVKINVRGGPEAIGMFQQPAAVRDGVVDMVHTPGSFYGAEVPEIDAMVASNRTVAETRANGGRALMNEIHEKRFNVHYLAQIDGDVCFHIYMVNPPKFRADGVLDLSGVKLRDNPIYHAFFEKLNAVTASMKSTEVYGALEKGTVESSAWTSIGLQQLKWDKFMKYRVDPCFYNTDLGIIVNLDKWNSLSDAAKKILTDVAVEVEQSSVAAREADRVAEEASLVANGMKLVAMSPAAGAKYIKMANDAAWARMRERLEKKGDTSFIERLRKLYYKE